MIKTRRLMGQATQRDVVANALKVAILVGTLLNLINQSEAVFGIVQLICWKLLLT